MRNCLSNKNDFIKDNSRRNKSDWNLSPQVVSKLKPPGYPESEHFKENEPQNWTTGKFVSIAPKPSYHSSLSQDGVIHKGNSHFTPLRQSSGNIANRSCVSEDKNLYRNSEEVGHGPKLALKRGHDKDGNLAGASKKKLFCEETPDESSDLVRRTFREKLDAEECYRIKIKGGDTAFPSMLLNLITEDDENATFNESCCRTEELEPNFPTEFSMTAVKEEGFNNSEDGSANRVCDLKQNVDQDAKEIDEVFTELSRSQSYCSPDYDAELSQYDLEILNDF